MISGSSIAAIIGVVAALVLAVYSLKAQDVRPRQAVRHAAIWAAIFGCVLIIVSRFAG